MNNMFIFMILAVIGYIGWDLWKTSKKIGKKQAKENFERFIQAIKEAETKEYIIGFIAFLAVFTIARGAMIWQNTAQECEVWYNEEMKIQLINTPTQKIIEEYKTNGFEQLPQNRSYNFYRRWFNEQGGRPSFINIQCNLKLNLQRLKKNIILDYTERKRW